MCPRLSTSPAACGMMESASCPARQEDEEGQRSSQLSRLTLARARQPITPITLVGMGGQHKAATGAGGAGLHASGPDLNSTLDQPWINPDQP